MQRRDFIKLAVASTAALALDGVQAGPTTDPLLPPTRRVWPAGPTAAGIDLSLLGFGGILVMNAEQDHANRLVAEMVEKGVSYFDVAPSYGDAEEHLGPALAPYRKNVFLACKTGQRQREAAEQEMKRSLERLKTDYFDLYQLHGITDKQKDVDAAFAKGGAIELFTQAKKDGRVRHLGFSAHNVEAALAAMDRYDFDSILFPLNFATFHRGNFGPQILEKAEQKGVARLALKMLARQKWPQDDPARKSYPKCWYEPVTDRHEAELAVKFTLSQPITAALPPGDERIFRRALELAMSFRKITPEEQAEVKVLAQKLDPLFQA